MTFFMVKITDVQLGRILELSEQGLTQKNAEKLAVKQYSISRALTKYRKHGNILHLGSSGRLNIISSKISSKIFSMLNRKPKISLRKTAKGLELDYRVKISGLNSTYLDDPAF